MRLSRAALFALSAGAGGSTAACDIPPVPTPSEMSTYVSPSGDARANDTDGDATVATNDPPQNTDAEADSPPASRGPHPGPEGGAADASDAADLATADATAHADAADAAGSGPDASDGDIADAPPEDALDDHRITILPLYGIGPLTQ